MLHALVTRNNNRQPQVPAKENLAAAREVLRNNSNATVIELPRMNHLLQDAKTGAPNEYNGIEETKSPVAIKIIADWLSRYALGPRRKARGSRSTEFTSS
jgi:hypothetical protein